MRSNRVVEVVAPSRIHLGLLSFGSDDRRQFGGAGFMIDTPSIRVRVTPASRLHVVGRHPERTTQFVEHWLANRQTPGRAAFRMEIIEAPRQHTGLGCGTQLGLAVATALTLHFGESLPSPAELSLSMNRGRRSAVGTYGFATGGFIVEGGKRQTDAISPLDWHWPLPDDWRIVVVCPTGQGISGRAEAEAFRQLPDVPLELTRQLKQELRDRIVPALVQADFEQFATGVHQFGRLAGKCFAEHQGGPYNGPRITRLIERIQSLGVQGVGQSSWGPAVYALLPDEPAALKLVELLSTRNGNQAAASEGDSRHDPVLNPDEIWIAAPNNRGAFVTVDETETIVPSPGGIHPSQAGETM